MNHVIFLIAICVKFIFSQNRGREHMSTDYTNVNINRTIDLSSNIITVESRILIKSMKVDPIYSYRLPLFKNSSQYLINIDAKFKSLNEDEQIKLKISKQYKHAEDIFDYYEINFKSEPMNYEEERILIIREDYFERLNMLPKRISLKESQLVVLKDTINHVSFYPTSNQITYVILPDSKTEVMYFNFYIVNIQRQTLLEIRILSNILLIGNSNL